MAECGFEGCEASVRRTVAELRCNIHDIFVPLSYEPAEAVQVDWGEVTIILGGCKQKIQIWCMRECYSGDIFVTAFYTEHIPYRCRYNQKHPLAFPAHPEPVGMYPAR